MQLVIRTNNTKLHLDEALQAITEIAEIAQSIEFVGAEPTRHTYLRQMVERAKFLGLRVIIRTNGSSRPRHYKRLAEAGVDSFEVSPSAFDPKDFRTKNNPGRVHNSTETIRELGLLTMIE